MPTIKVNTTRLNSCESELYGILSRVNSIMSQFNSVSGRLDWDVKAESRINSRLSEISRELSAESRGLSGMKNYLGTARSKYVAVESKNSGKKLGSEVVGSGLAVNATVASAILAGAVGNAAGKIGNGVFVGGIAAGMLADWSKYIGKVFSTADGKTALPSLNAVAGATVGEVSTSSCADYLDALSMLVQGKLFYENKEVHSKGGNQDPNAKTFIRSGTKVFTEEFKIGNVMNYKDGKYISDSINDLYQLFTDSDDNLIPKQKKKSLKKINGDDDFYDQKASIAEVKEGKSIEGSVLHLKAEGESKYAQGNIELKALTGEAHYSGQAGFYVYDKGPDGEVKRIFSPGVSAEVGASASILEIAGDGRVGFGEDNKMLGLYGKGELEAYSAEARGKVSLNTNELYLGVGAEANLFKATGTGGVSVIGTDIGVTGSVKVGVGAHADVGFTDWKLKVDVGVAVGLGVDVGFEVDMSGTVDAICDIASSAWDTIKWW